MWRRPEESNPTPFGAVSLAGDPRPASRSASWRPRPDSNRLPLGLQSSASTALASGSGGGTRSRTLTVFHVARFSRPVAHHWARPSSMVGAVGIEPTAVPGLGRVRLPIAPRPLRAGAGGGSRTRMVSHDVLSAARIPVPPLRRSGGSVKRHDTVPARAARAGDPPAPRPPLMAVAGFEPACRSTRPSDVRVCQFHHTAGYGRWESNPHVDGV